MLRFCRLCLIVVLVAAGMPAYAVEDAPAPTHGIAMHGQPKYGPDFAYFDYVNPDAPKGGMLRQGVVGSFDSLNPFIVRGVAAQGLSLPSSSNLVFLPLMARSWDEPFTLYGLIAESIRTPDDRSWVEFTVRPEARWHDGQPITADDVLFTWETLRTKGRPNHRAYYNRVEKAEKTGERTVRFTFKPTPEGVAPDREMPLIMGLMPILPQHWWATRTFENTTLEPPMGSGPYQVAVVDPGRSITFTRVKDWWGQNLPVMVGMHNVDTIRFDYYRDDSVALEAFKAHAYDIRREMDATKWASAYDVPAARDGRMVVETISHGRPEWARGLIYNTRRPIFQDRNVRAALAYAFDFEWMNRALFHGAFKRITSYYPNSELAASGLPSAAELAILEPHRDQLPPEVFTQAYAPPSTDGRGPTSLRANLRTAQTLLKQAGWGVQNGRLVNANGEPFTFEILLNDPSDERVALEFTRALERIGIQATIRTVDSAQYQGRLDAFDFDMTINKWVSSLSPGNEQITFWGSNFADRQGSRNYPGIRNPAIDALANGIATATTREDLVNRVHALDRALLWGHYFIPLYHIGGDQVAYWQPLHRPAVTPLYGMTLETWWMGGDKP